VISLAGIPFAFEPAEALTDDERSALRSLQSGVTATLASSFSVGKLPFRVRLTDEPPWTSDDPRRFRDQAPAVVNWHAGALDLSHAAFTARLDLFAGTARLYRARISPVGVLTTLRVALSGLLPLQGGLPLHAAAVVIDGRGLVFFGPSGAGKSTLAAASPFPVLSDELVAAVSDTTFAVSATGFCRPPGGVVAGRFPMRALIQLAKGPTFQLSRLQATEARRRLIGVLSVPAAPPLWTRSLEVLGRLVREVPCYRMVWSPAEPPWPLLHEALERDRS
jgi:hypothetical protein